MNDIISVFQFEVRYNHILHFSQIARKLLTPYVRLTQSIKIDNRDTIEERIILNFEQDSFIIIASWDRLLLKGQANLDNYTIKNSPMESIFFAILSEIKKIEEFGSILNLLLAVNAIKEYDVDKERVTKHFLEHVGLESFSSIMANTTDAAVILEEKIGTSESNSVKVGPYFGVEDLKKGPLYPVNIANLGEVEFKGIMLEYKRMIQTNDVKFSTFVDMIETSMKTLNKVWKKF